MKLKELIYLLNHRKFLFVIGIVLLISSYISYVSALEDDVFIKSSNIIEKNNDYKIILENNITSDIIIDNNSLYLNTERDFYVINKTDGNITYKLHISGIKDIKQTNNFTYLKTDYVIYKINKTSGIIEQKQIYNFIIDSIYTFFGVNTLSSEVNNYNTYITGSSYNQTYDTNISYFISNQTNYSNINDYQNKTLNYINSSKVNKSGDKITGEIFIDTDGTNTQLVLSSISQGSFTLNRTDNKGLSIYSPSKHYFGIYDNDNAMENFTMNGGKLFIKLGSGAQSSALCYNSGTIEATYNSGITTCTASNESLKTDITPITGNITSFVMNLTPIKYHLQFENQDSLNGGWHTGFSAQSVKSQIAKTQYNNTLIGYNPDGTISGLRYEEMIPFLVKVIQEQQNTINSQQIDINNGKTLLNKICSNNQTLCR